MPALLILSLIFTFQLFATELTAEPALPSIQTYQVSPEHTFTYERPSGAPFVTNFWKDFRLLNEQYLDQEHLPALSGIMGLTLLGIYFDEDILLEAQRVGRHNDLPSEDKTKSRFKILGFDARFPTDLSSSLYFIGDGWVHGAVAVGFLTYGYFGKNYRAWSTSYQLIEGFGTVGASTQILKHLTGRESPFTRTQEGGVWRFFPDQSKYHQNVPYYDAFPSGHMATTMISVTVLSENYPEYLFIKPVGYTLMTLLGFQMLNNGVHWFSDYPLAIGMGYAFGKIAVNNHRKIEGQSKLSKNQRMIKPIYTLSPEIQEKEGVKSYAMGLKLFF